MYVDSRPVSGFSEPQGWRIPMPSPRPPGSLKRPPLVNCGSSSSSLVGMEQTVPSFQSFLQRTPPPDQTKPLPATPLNPRRASSASPPRSREPSLCSHRRSSSVYSRTVSQWFDDDSSWRSVDLRDDPLPAVPPLPILQPVAYSKSSPQLIERPATPPQPTLEPRTYMPLITSPSPTVSRVTTPNRPPAQSPGPPPFRQQQQQQPPPAVLYPMSPPVHRGAKRKAEMVSLAQAQAAVRSPGAVHLLPEELRAQTHARSRSHEIVRVSILKFFEGQKVPDIPSPLTPPGKLVDAHGRHRSLQPKDVDALSEYPFPNRHDTTFPASWTVLEERAPLETQPRKESQIKAAEALGVNAEEKPRGRTRERGPRSMDYSRHMPKGGRPASSPSTNEADDEETDAQKVTSEYHHMLSEEYCQPSSSPGYNSDDSIRAHMKMVPQPLFKNKPATKLPGFINERGSEQGSSISESPFHLRADSVDSKASIGTHGSFPMQLSLTPNSEHCRTTSTSGSIPISPPMAVASASSAPTERSTGCTGSSRKQKPRRSSEDERVSMYYPYVGSRKGRKAKERKASRAAPAMSLLPANGIAQRLETPNGSTEFSPVQSTPSISFRGKIGNCKESSASSNCQRAPLLQRLAGNAMKYADLMHIPSGLPGTGSQQRKGSEANIASPHSPHLHPSPVKSSPPPVHLGCSNSTKESIDRSPSSMQSAPCTPPTTHFTNLPAHPLDERYVEPPSRGRKESNSIFDGLLDGFRERKKVEKREELKRIIRVVPQLPPPQMATRDISQPGQARQASVGNGLPGVQRTSTSMAIGNRNSRPMSEGLGRRMSAMG